MWSVGSRGILSNRIRGDRAMEKTISDIIEEAIREWISKKEYPKERKETTKVEIPRFSIVDCPDCGGTGRFERSYGVPLDTMICPRCYGNCVIVVKDPKLS